MKDTGDKCCRRAVALRYDRDRSASPQIVASGRNEVAERIVTKAHENGVFVHEDRELVNVLEQLPLGQDIPEELYSAVAEILVFVYQLENRTPGSKSS